MTEKTKKTEKNIINKNCECCGNKIEMKKDEYEIFGCRQCGAIYPNEYYKNEEL